MRNSPLHRCWYVFVRRRRLMLLLFSLLFGAGIVYVACHPRLYASTATISVGGVTPTANTGGGTGTTTDALGSALETISGPQFLDDAFETFSWSHKADDFGHTGRLSPQQVRVTADANSNTLHITVRSPNPRAASALANHLATTFLTMRAREFHTQRVQIEQNLQQIGTQLAKARQEITQYKQQTGLISPDAQFAKAAEMITNVQAERDTLKAQLASVNQTITLLRQRLKGQHPLSQKTMTANNQRYLELQKSLQALQDEKTRLQNDPKIDPDAVAQVQRRIDAAEEQVQALVSGASQAQSQNSSYQSLQQQLAEAQTASASTAARLRVLEQSLQARQAEAAAMPKREGRFADMLFAMNQLSGTYQTLAQRSQALLAIEADPSAGVGSVVSRATVSRAPISLPWYSQTLLAFLLASLITLSIAIVVDAGDRHVHSLETVEAITGLPLLTVAPTCNRSDERYAESFRILQQSVSLSTDTSTCRTLAFTCPDDSEAAARVCVELAQTFATAGKRVVVVDANFHSPTLQTALPVSSLPGVGEFLLGQTSLSESVHSHGDPAFSFMPAGDAKDTVIDGAQLAPLLQQLRQEFDCCLVIAPPCSGRSDAQVVTALVDGIVLVVALNRTARARLYAAQRLLYPLRGRILGTVITDVEDWQGTGFFADR